MDRPRADGSSQPLPAQPSPHPWPRAQCKPVTQTTLYWQDQTETTLDPRCTASPVHSSPPPHNSQAQRGSRDTEGLEGRWGHGACSPTQELGVGVTMLHSSPSPLRGCRTLSHCQPGELGCPSNTGCRAKLSSPCQRGTTDSSSGRCPWEGGWGWQTCQPISTPLLILERSASVLAGEGRGQDGVTKAHGCGEVKQNSPVRSCPQHRLHQCRGLFPHAMAWSQAGWSHSQPPKGQ